MPWLIAGTIVGAGLALAAVAYNALKPAPLPPEEPLALHDTRATLRGGVWRVEMDVEVLHSCETIEVDRRFAPDGGVVRRQAPIASYLDQRGWQLGSAPYSVAVEAGQALSLWHTYLAVPGDYGNLIVEVTAWGCDNGFQGPVLSERVPYDWRTP